MTQKEDVIRPGTVIASTILVLAAAAASPAHGQTLASVGPAYVSRDAKADTWTLGNDAFAVTLGFDRAGEFRIVSLEDARSGRESELSAGSDSVLTLDGELYEVGSKSGGFTFTDANASELSNGVQLDVTFELRSPSARVTRSYVCYTDAPVIETWTGVEASRDQVAMSDLNVWQLVVPPGTVRWVTGLQAGPDQGGSFTIQRRALEPGDRLALGAAQRSSEAMVPVFAIEREGIEVFGGLMWSGSWSAAVERRDEDVKLSIGLTGFTTQIVEGSTFESPHGFFGVSAGASSTSAALAKFAAAIRNGRPFPALVTYNTWFAYGTRVDEANVLEEMERVARLGAEVFVLDAGWYPDTGRDGADDFTSGVGALRVDEARFPSGLTALSDRARELGMKFGIWVEPARTALSLVGTPDGPPEAWLATRDGKYDPAPDSEPVAVQVCFGGASARRWLLDRLAAFIDAVRPDYLKWDNNFFVNCDREGHDHSSSDGNLRHTQGLYEILAALRERYPDLTIENVSGGGNLLDFGALGLTDVAWMDDRSAPSVHVRHNLEGLSTFFPPAYLFSFVMADEDEPMSGATDMAMFARSRMPGSLGFTFRSSDLAESDTEQLAVQIGQYKTFREAVRGASAVLLTPQAAERAEGGWDVLEERADNGDVLLFAFQQPRGQGATIVRPVGLLDNAIYSVDSIDRGNLGEATGAELMERGIEIVESPFSAAHILTLRIRTIRDPGAGPGL